MKELVSIITPVYNGHSLIAETIESVQRQSYSNWELIIIDDASTDGTADILASYANADPRIRIISQSENQGAAIARNLGLAAANGPLIAFLDADDLWDQSKLEVQLPFMMSRNLAISYSSYEIVEEDGKPTGRTVTAIPVVDQARYLKTTIIGCSTAIIDRRLVGEISFYNLRTRQDTHLWITLLGQGHLAYGLPQVLTKYRLRGNSISSNKIKAARQVWQLYYSIVGLGFFRSVFYFTHYAANGVMKRL